MKCPACLHELTSIETADITLDACKDGCGGVWFDAFELQRLEKADEADIAVLHVPRDPCAYVDPQRKRDCPRCDDTKLRRHFFSAQRKVEVDHCPNCNGYWLDAGELDNIRAEKADAAKADKKGIPMEVIRTIYRQRLEEKEDSQG